MKRIIYPSLVFLAILVMPACKLFQKNRAVKTVNTIVDIEQPKLAIVLSVDQMRFDYLERFDKQFVGGFRRLLDEGAVMSNANYSHAVTGTAPGHATIATGCHPSKHGIVANNFYLPETGEFVYAVEDKDVKFEGVEKIGKSASPHQLRVSTLGDWVKKESQQSKVYSVAVKDRSAVLMGGKDANRAFWFDKKSTKMISSDFYKEPFPKWSDFYIGKNMFKSSLEKGWTKLKKEEVYESSRADNFPFELGIQRVTFPHTLYSFMPPVSNSPYEARKGLLMAISPFGDAYALEYAKALIENEKLGMREVPDVLMIGCSVADKIGHHFGPYSQEIQDYYLRLDLYLGNFFTYLDERIGRENYYVVLSADHGVVAMPEELTKKGKDAQRITKQQFRADIDSMQVEVKRQLVLKNDFVKHFGKEGIALDYAEIENIGISKAVLRSKVASVLLQIPYVEQVYTPEDYFSKTPKKDIRFFRNSYDEKRGMEIKIKFDEYALVNVYPNGTSHGSIYDYDTHIPMIFMGPQVKPGQYAQSVKVVDLAPTMARVLGVSIPAYVDGLPLDYIFKPMPKTTKEGQEKDKAEEVKSYKF